MERPGSPLHPAIISDRSQGPMPAFTELPLALNLLLFLAAAVVVFFAGSRLSLYADTISSITGIGHAAMGFILLAGITSLPEIAVTVVATLDGHADLAANNLLGTAAIHVVLLAAVDFAVGRRPLTASVPEPAVMLGGNLNVLLLAIVVCGMVVGDFLVFGAGVWSWICLLFYLGSVFLLGQEEGREPWVAADQGRPDRDLIREVEKNKGRRRTGLRETLLWVSLAGVLILVAGFVVARSGEALAEQTGLGAGFVGFVLIAVSTSLPEASTALAAARHGHFVMAISDVLGTNLLNVALIFLIDILAPGGPVLADIGAFSTFGALLAIILTAMFLAGLAQRREGSLLRMGYDSVAIILAYCGGIALLFAIR
ncbi:sodium:calcium antiporter [Chelativorans sp.]|uniref:sodium:calcium antiporter n=1 Tax=Chelativorans sp. TaxID=2203393 RepID=UPI002811189D|nr:sodium:calcium antiporter [Chelativorans sp.]